MEAWEATWSDLLMAKSIILVAGSPGAGKTTVLKEAGVSLDCKIVNMGTTMLEVGQKLGYVTDRDQIRYLSLKKFNEVRNKALDEIEKVAGNILIDTHASVGENGRYLPGFPVSFLNKLGHVKGLIYIDAPTKDIIERRSDDPSRKREHDDAHTIDAQRLINISMLSFASAYLNIPLYVVINRQDSLRKTVAEIKGRVHEVLGASD
ncbi:MAG: AAA family ATPase [Candidatus Micrarchaeota archaeon]|nr:AAA family ATPase [Candidatus Micrarchaeota archaeon]